jgi:uncharacterized damage-inducible protein DinB
MLMRRVTGILVLVLALAAATPMSAEAQRRGGGPPAPTCTTFACDAQADWDRTAALLIGIAEAMPEDKYSFKSTPAQRSFGEHVLHIAQVDGFLLGTLGAKAPRPAINMKATTKADIIAALRQSFDWGKAVIAEFNDAQLVERVKGPPFLGATASRAKIFYYSLQHTQDTYGQMVVYLRLNGLVPPASGGV